MVSHSGHLSFWKAPALCAEAAATLRHPPGGLASRKVHGPAAQVKVVKVGGVIGVTVAPVEDFGTGSAFWAEVLMLATVVRPAPRMRPACSKSNQDPFEAFYVN